MDRKAAIADYIKNEIMRNKNAKLDFDDLGLPKSVEDDLYSHLMRLGDKKLLPMKEVNGKNVSYVDLLDNVDSAARHWLDKMSFKTHWGSFIPFTMYQEWKKGDAEYQAEYFKLRDEICSNYTDILARLRNEYAAMASAAYRRNSVLKSISTSESAFVTKFVENVMRMVPDSGSIYASFGYEVDVAYIPLPSEMEKDLAKARRVRMEADIADQGARMKVEALRAMTNDVVRQAREKKEQLIDTFLRDIAVQVRSLVYDTVLDVSNSIKGNDGKLLGRSSMQLSNLIQKVEKLNFYQDSEITAMIGKVKELVGQPAKDRDRSEVINILRDIGVLTRASLLALGDTPRSGRSIGIPSVPANGMLRQARESLGLDKKITVPTMERKGRKVEVGL